MQIETNSETAVRLATLAALKASHDRQVRAEQVAAADTLLGCVTHVTMWTEPNGRARHETRIEALS